MNNDVSVPVVILDVNLQALKILRDLGRQGIRIIGVVPTTEGRWETSSRYCETRVFPQLEAGGEPLMHYLEKLAGELGCRPVLIPLQDDLVLFVATFQERLRQWFRFLVSDPVVTEKLVSKEGVRELADRAGIPQPLTVTPASYDELARLAGTMRYPALIKPTYSRTWLEPDIRKAVDFGKVVSVADAGELLEKYALLAKYDPGLVVQEQIPGDDENLVYYVGYFDETSNPLASFVGIKERVTPIHYGSASYVVSSRNPELVEQSIRFMQAVGYKGHVGIEYKYDSRDRLYKLIEVNARFGLWDGMATRCGINFSLINYRYLLGQTPEWKQDYEEGVKWISFERDLEAFMQYRKTGLLTAWQWLRSIATGKRDYAVFAWDDPAPFFQSGRALAPVYGKAVLKRLKLR